MATLRLTQSPAASDGSFSIEIAREGAGPRLTAFATVMPMVSEQDRSSIRWYLEDYLQYYADPAPKRAAAVEKRMADLGRALFQSIFEANKDALRIWHSICDDLSTTRIEISTEVREANSIPWELLRDPSTDAPLALSAAEFVRVQSQAAREPKLPDIQPQGPVRLLLVICRPGGEADVPFRSVASRLVKGLTEAGNRDVQLEVLRPPTFEQLGRVLRRAKDDKAPFHIVHFDGHGLYANREQLDELVKHTAFDPNLLKVPGSGAHGYICFEHATVPNQVWPVDGTTLGNLLYDTDVPVLVLNACRSALGDTKAEADADAETLEPEQHDQVRVYGSFAQAVADAGVAGVVAMRYNVFVPTAAQFVGELYQVLDEGSNLGHAVSRARKHLSDMPTRIVPGKRIDLQDWTVPTVHEAAPIQLFAKREVGGPLFAAGTRWEADLGTDELPAPPDAGFFGRDETLLALDRAFDRRNIVLMHAYAGSGKTATAAEFARWYQRTGGINGPILFDSFARYHPLPQLLDRIGTLFAPLLQTHNIQWLALNDLERRKCALAILSRQPVLWIWDNVEPVTGFPAGTSSAWSKEEQTELAEFLRALRNTKAKVLLTSRRDEQAWLGDLPALVRVPPMPMRERQELAEALILSRGGDARILPVLAPLLAFCQGNPLTLTVLIGQAVKNGVQDKTQVDTWVDRLRAGEKGFDDDLTQGRSRSLGASLAYGFEHGFTDEERRRLALLHLFQEVVNVGVLVQMGAAGNPHRQPDYAGLSVAYWQELANRAADIGLLTRLTPLLFRVHPAVPWFLRDMFERFYPATGDDKQTSPAMRATRAYAEVMAALGSSAKSGHHSVSFAALQAEEENLLYSWRLARRNGWLDLAIWLAGILGNFYSDSGRQIERVRLLRTTVSEFIDTKAVTALPGREAFWRQAMTYWMQAELCERNFVVAERLFTALSVQLRQQIGPALSKPAGGDGSIAPEHELIAEYVNTARIWIGGLVARGGPENLAAAASLGEEVFALAIRIGDRDSAAAVAYHLGHCYFDMGGPDNLATAEQWYQKSMDPPPDDAIRTSMRLFELAQVRYARTQHAVRMKSDPATLERLFNEALQSARTAQAKTVPEHLEGQMRINHLLGNIFDDAGALTGTRAYLEDAEKHYQEYIRLAERINNPFEAATGCREMARLKWKQRLFDDALLYAEESARKCQRLGPAATAALEMSRRMIADIGRSRDAAGGTKAS